MKKMYKGMLLVLCAVLLVAASVMGTLAYLKSETKTVTNTFTVGKVAIVLKEYEINNEGKATNTVIEANNQTIAGIKLVPKRVIEKHPFITIAQGSEKCYLFVKIENSVPSNYGAIDLNTENWIKLTQGSGIYYYKTTVDGSSGNIDVFTKFTCAEGVTEYTQTTGLNIAITAYAVQAEGFDTALAAWNATFGASANP